MRGSTGVERSTSYLYLTVRVLMCFLAPSLYFQRQGKKNIRAIISLCDHLSQNSISIFLEIFLPDISIKSQVSNERLQCTEHYESYFFFTIPTMQTMHSSTNNTFSRVSSRDHYILSYLVLYHSPVAYNIQCLFPRDNLSFLSRSDREIITSKTCS